VRAAAAFALGATGGEQAIDVLGRQGDAQNTTLRAMTVLSLARLRAPAARRAIAAGLVSADVALREAAAAAAYVLSTGEYRLPQEPLPLPSGRVDATTVVLGLRPSGYTPDERAKSIVDISPDLAASALTAVHATPEGARAVADAVLARNGKPAFAPLSNELESASPKAQKSAEEALVHTSAALVEPFVALSKHPSADTRARAVRFLSSRDEPKAKAALVAALHDPDPTVLGAALDSFSADPDRLPIDAVTDLAKKAESWPVRARAAEALGALRKGPAESRAVSVLASVAERDSIAFVREAAVRALGSFGPSSKEALARVAATDAEPRLRTLAKNLLEGTK
jgi:HEAT repeat protein